MRPVKCARLRRRCVLLVSAVVVVSGMRQEWLDPSTPASRRPARRPWPKTSTSPKTTIREQVVAFEAASRSNASASTRPRVAILSVGLVRTMLHPELVPSLALMTSSLEAARFPHELFMFASIAGDAFASKPRAMASLRAKIEAAYHPRRVWLSQANLKCENCAGRVDCTKQKAFDILRQFHKFHLAFEALRDYEATSAQPPFDWVLKVRPDLIWFEPLPLTPWITAAVAAAHGRARDARVFVPHGVMTREPRMQRHNDHVFLCPREACRPYFDQLFDNYRTCKGTLNKEDFFDEVYGGRTDLFEVAYTIARETGIECDRMTCSGNRYSTGCEAPHLTEFADTCAQVNQRWNQHKRRLGTGRPQPRHVEK